MKLLFLALLAPAIAFGQQQICTIHVVITGGQQPPAQAQLMGAKVAHSADALISGDSILIRDTLQSPGSANLLISYKGTESFRWVYPLFLEAGDITLTIDRPAGLRGDMRVKGPRWTQEFSAALQEPIRTYNNQIGALKKQLKQPGQDTVALQQQIASLTHLCFGVPRDYIKQNPSSPLVIMALQFMGKGDPTIPHPVEELEALFHSLPADVQNGEVGKQYAEKLGKMVSP